MATKYFTHFVTTAEDAAAASEWSGVVELEDAEVGGAIAAGLRSCLAESFNVESEDIRILQWARLH